ncbi:MAG: sugar phosphate isomerase/epimerase [Alicyclobacillus sp.]|nr:sugar phosphate isomerase/epimerase [Alicyclobacillus sp.]
MGRLKIGLQMYTVRDEARKDFVGTLRRVAELGYEGVEFAGYGGLSAEELSRSLREFGLEAVGSHIDVFRLRDHLEEEVAFQSALGCRYAVCPGLPEEFRRDETAWRKTFDLLEACGRRFREAGITFGYHNHSFEFEQTVGGQFAFDALFAATSPEHVQAEMDVCWVQHAGQDPVAYVRRYAGRLPLIHLKDLRLSEDGRPLTVVLGQGMVDLPAVISAAEEAGAEWLIVEQDECQAPPLESIADDIAWLREHYLGR